MRHLSRYVLLVGCCLTGFLVSAYANVRYTGKTFRDPFTDPGTDTAKKDAARLETSYESLKLQGILYDVGNPRAIVNGKIVAVGDIVTGQAMVSAINKDEVILEANGKKYVLKQNVRKTTDDTEPKKTPIIKKR